MTGVETAIQPRNTLRLKATASALRCVTSVAELEQALLWARSRKLSVLPLGEGSNVVLLPRIDALVLQIQLTGRELLQQDGAEVLLRVAAGENWHALVAWTLAQGYCGLENLALIPGTVGAAPVQNIGAYGRELAPFVAAVHALRCADASPLLLTRADCRFAYRDSVFKRELRDQVVITHVDLRLPLNAATESAYPGLREALAQRGETDSPTPQAVFDAVVALRRAKLPDPAREPNVGSFFKNPVLPRTQAEALCCEYPELPLYPAGPAHRKLPAAWLIERAGWKGSRRGAVGVHPGHALVLVNYGADSGSEVLRLATEIQASVQARFGVALELEPRVYGEPA
ncbi:UDP-N-acetylmuramate dehydrogenase [Haliea sp. E1-2-M8]|uniref:UDP-N-acetylmuramate dehydrogenase n=1 Tax=Haliea sp. E1-2-M8 TaxID=3064706 RepID=UPI00272053F7|nr:UDP-N-acetylmuramate dehydrogenase [Haliea sp. E1-2-M8]MDO8862386.1 UDP-N-acetylmuramate dehydrogenase [Haliea sp. E1-2-M8]